MHRKSFAEWFFSLPGWLFMAVGILLIAAVAIALDRYPVWTSGALIGWILRDMTTDALNYLRDRA